jgi:outer membrane protein OmpA-like peptidoglycan-associated protein
MSDAPHRGRRVIAPLAVAAVGLAAIFLAEDLPTRHSVESKLTDRSLAALHNAGLQNVTVDFTGRDGTVRVLSAIDSARARSIVQDQEGVRVAKVVVVSALPPAAPVPPPSPSPVPPPTAPPSTLPSQSAPPSPSTSTPSTDAVHRQIVTAGPVEFDTGSATLTTASHPVLAKIAAILNANPTMRIRIEGNTDSIGSAAHNLELSKQRAQAVYDALMALGISADRMSTVGYGETHPQVPNTSEHNRAINRRVSFTLSQ